MNVRSSLIQMLAVSLGGDIEVPETLMPTIELIYPHSFSTFNVNNDFRGKFTSTMVWAQDTLAPSAAATDRTMATFDKGVYRLDCRFLLRSDLIDTFASYPGHGIYLTDSAGLVSSNIIEQGAIVGQQTESVVQTFAFTQSGWTLHMFTNGTQVAQNLSAYARVYVQQLL